MTNDQKDVKDNMIKMIHQGINRSESVKDKLDVIDSWYWLLNVYKANGAEEVILNEVKEFLDNIVKGL